MDIGEKARPIRIHPTESAATSSQCLLTQVYSACKLLSYKARSRRRSKRTNAIDGLGVRRWADNRCFYRRLSITTAAAISMRCT
jgi:hypothetical protein